MHPMHTAAIAGQGVGSMLLACAISDPLPHALLLVLGVLEHQVVGEHLLLVTGGQPRHQQRHLHAATIRHPSLLVVKAQQEA